MFLGILIQNFAIFFSILLIASISGIFSERVGIINIAINGMMVVGGVTYVLFSQLFNIANPWMQIPLVIIAGIGGALFALFHGYATIKLKANQVISGVAINILAIGVALIILEIATPNNKFHVPTTELALAPTGILSTISLKIFLAIIIVLITWFALNKTIWGLRFRSIGENPQAADVAGINVNKFKWQGIILSGAFAGIAGAFWAAKLGQRFETSVNGLGFLAIAIMIMGQWRIHFTLIVALLFSFFTSLGNSLAVEGPFINYSGLFKMFPYVITLMGLVIFSKKSQAPKAIGVPYYKST